MNATTTQKPHRMNETAVIVPTAQTALTAQAFAAKEVISAFLAQADCKESSRRLYARTLPLFFAWITRTGRQLNAITRADIIAYRDGLINGQATTDGAGRSPLTAAAYLTAVKLFYKWLESVGAYPNVAAGIKMPERSNRFEREPLTAEQAHELCEEAARTGNLRDAAILSLLLRCGLRTIEVTRADVCDIVERGGILTLNVQGKGRIKKDNFVTISGKCAADIQAYLSTRSDIAGKTAEQLQGVPLFLCDSRNASYLTAKAAKEGRTDAAETLRTGRLTTRTISAIAKKHLQAIGLNSRAYTAHSLRHTFGCLSLDLCNDVNEVQLQLRHQSVNTTKQYIYHRDEQRRIALAKKYSIDNLI